jgi:hypothetical protein
MQFTNKHGLPRALVEVITTDDYDYSDDPMSISVSTLVDSPKIKFLRALHWHEMVVDVSDLIWKFYGIMSHKVMEDISKKDRIIEVRINEQFHITIDGKKITYIVRGKPDIYDKLDEILSDYKTTSVWAWIFGSEKKNFERQINIYAYMLRGQGYTPKILQDDMLLRDWRKSEARENPDYPPVAYGKLVQRQWTDKEVEDYLTERLELFHRSGLKDPDELECSPEERWEKPTTFAVFTPLKDGSRMKSRADKVEPTMDAAKEWVRKNDLSKFEIIERKGRDTRCQDEYCGVRFWCNYWKEKYSKDVNHG